MADNDTDPQECHATMTYAIICHKRRRTKRGIYGTKQQKMAQNSDVVFPLKAFGGKLTYLS